MKISGTLKKVSGKYLATLSTKGDKHIVEMSAKESGAGTRANGGELLCLALASCYCNDIYREAAGRNIDVVSVEVEVHAEFGGVGESAKEIKYSPTVKAHAAKEEIELLVLETDKFAEIHNTRRQGMAVGLSEPKAVSVD